MKASGAALSNLCAMAIVAVVYIICHGITAWVVAPVQHYFLGDITIFASLLYLPHGVRVLSTWLLGWRAVAPLAVGAFVSEVIFTEADVRAMLEHVLLFSIAIGALSAWVAFEILRVFGASAYVGAGHRMNWRKLLMVGMLASVLNSIGQTYVFAGVISPGDQITVIVTYAAGDLIGQAVAMVALMFLFRALRASA